MTLNEIFAQGIKISENGAFAIIFVVLALAAVVLIKKNSSNKKTINKENEECVSNLPSSAVEETKADDGELIAVLTAAIAASLNTSTYNLKIKSLKRIGSAPSSWRKAGIYETLNSRF